MSARLDAELYDEQRARTITVADVRRISLQPGETLVVSLPGPLSMTVAAFVKRHIEHVFPDNRVLVCETGTDFAVITEETP